MKRVTVITVATDQEWPADHPLRDHTRVVTRAWAEMMADVLICSRVGEPRTPPPPGDSDVEGACGYCGHPVLHRASAPERPRLICCQCWNRFANPGPN